MRVVALVLAALILSAEGPVPDLQQFDAALNQYRLNDAATIVTKLIEQRTPADGQPKPDALLNALIGRLDLSAREADNALAYLESARLTELPVSLRGLTALAHGKALEFTGNRAKALDAFRDAQIYATTGPEKVHAQLGIARQLLAVDPAAARDQVRPIAQGSLSSDRWEAKYLLAASASLLRDRSTADRLAEEAWEDSASGELSGLAPLNVAALRGALAAVRGDQDFERAMLIATNGLSLSASSELGAQIPMCGDHGLKPSDTVTFAFTLGPFGMRRLLPVGTNRLAAVAPFADALASVTVIKTQRYIPVGTVFTVSCRPFRSIAFISGPREADPLLAWFVARGIYPVSPTNNVEDKELNHVADRVGALRSRFGDDSPLLIEARMQLAGLLERRRLSGDAVPEGQTAGLMQQVANGLRHAGAPDWLAQIIETREQLKLAAAAAAKDPSQAEAAAKLARDQIMRLPFRYARQLLISTLANIKGD